MWGQAFLAARARPAPSVPTQLTGMTTASAVTWKMFAGWYRKGMVLRGWRWLFLRCPRGRGSVVFCVGLRRLVGSGLKVCVGSVCAGA